MGIYLKTSIYLFYHEISSRHDRLNSEKNYRKKTKRMNEEIGGKRGFPAEIVDFLKPDNFIAKDEKK